MQRCQEWVLTGTTGAPRVHPNRNFPNVESHLSGKDEGLHGVPQILSRIVDTKEPNRSGAGSTEPGGCIGDPSVTVPGDDPREQPDRQPSHGVHLVRSAVSESATHDDISGTERLHELRNVPGIVLSVGIELNDGIEAVHLRVGKASSHRGTDAEVDRVGRYSRTTACGGPTCLIAGTIIHDEKGCRGASTFSPADDFTQRCVFIQSREHDEHTRNLGSHAPVD